MADIKKLIDSLNGLDSDEALDKVARAVKTGEAGVSQKDAVALANKLLPLLDRKQQEKVRKLIRRINQ